MIIGNDEIFEVPYLSDSRMSLIYAPLRGLVILVAKDDAEKLFSNERSDEKSEIINHIKSNAQIDIRDIANYLESDVPEVSISLTNGCSMSCIYCSAHAGEHPPIVIKENEIEQILNYYFHRIDTEFPNAKYASLGFLGGGEPTTQPKLLKYAVKTARSMAKSRGKKVHIGTASNGLFNQNMAEFILNEFDYLSLSLDGPEIIQNAHRPLKNGGKTFETVFKTAKFFQKNSFDFAFRATVSKISLQHYQELIDFFSDNFPETSVGFEPLYKLGRGEGCEIAPSEQEYAEGMKKITEYAQSKNACLKNIDEELFEAVRPFYCSSVAVPNMNITPTGQIWACARESDETLFNYGYFDFNTKEVFIDKEKIKKIKKMNVFNYPECKDCACKYHCSGDCPDNRNAGHLIKCDSTREGFILALNRYYNNDAMPA